MSYTVKLRLSELKSEVGVFVNKRINEFKILGEKEAVIFDFKPFLDLTLHATPESELAFCISTANSSAKAGLVFQSRFRDDMKIEEVEWILKSSGVRFYRRKAEYIVEAMRMREEIFEVVMNRDSRRARKWLVDNVRGLGWKEASHLLRNLGREDVAIIDRHVVRWVSEIGDSASGRFERKFESKEYQKIEDFLEKIASSLSISLAELDLLIWFDRTGKVLK